MAAITEADTKKVNQICQNVMTFSSQHVSGMLVGATTSYQKSLLTLRKHTKILENAADQQVKSAEMVHAIDNFEGSLQSATTMSAGSTLGSDLAGYINPQELDVILDFLDSLRDKLEK